MTINSQYVMKTYTFPADTTSKYPDRAYADSDHQRRWRQDNRPSIKPLGRNVSDLVDRYQVNRKDNVPTDVPPLPIKYGVGVFIESLLKHNISYACSGPDFKRSLQSRIGEIITHTGLSSYFSGKLSMAEIMKVGEESSLLCSDDTKSIKAKLFFRKLTMLEYFARDRFDDYHPNVEQRNRLVPRTRFNFTSNSIIPTKALRDMEQPHPIDHFLMAYLCGNHFLRQMFVQKAILCRLAIPFLYPSPFHANILECMIWPLRFVVFEVKQNNGELRDIDAVSAHSNIVTFCRVGRSKQYQKSQILNHLLSEDGMHPTFHTWGQPNSDRERLISDGVVEAAWYIPGARGDSFPNLTLFLNLRGESKYHPNQVQFLCNISSVVVIVVEMTHLNDEIIRELAVSAKHFNCKVIFLLNNDTMRSNDSHVRRNIEKMEKKLGVMTDVSFVYSFTQTGGRPMADIKEELRLCIAEYSKDSRKKSLGYIIENMDYSNVIFVDENEKECIFGKSLAESITKHVDHSFPTQKMLEIISEIKHNQLPLQGYLWKKWSLLEKTKSRPKSRTYGTLNINNELEREMMSLREEQYYVSRESSMMASFLESISKSVRGEVNHRLFYFLNWLKLFFDNMSRITFPFFLDNCREKWAALQDYKENENFSSNHIKHLQESLEGAEKELSSASLGLEHLFRELGQMYEATQACSSHANTVEFDQYAMITARLVLAGYPLEVMDGDAVNMPLRWLKSVLRHIRSIVGKKKLFVVSVLGIQSSGKSTLLNTMFGLQFAVSAARCTRGVFMQVIEVDTSNDLPFHYVCVIDSEGLRAPEMGKVGHDHDNELATLVIGIGDVTLINVKGENYCEMRDILQIAVHAFLRMKLVSYDHQRCLFIHQNVSVATAKDKLKYGCQKLQEYLDARTAEAAKVEGKVDIKTFNRVIKFDCREDVFFFPDFWQGDPPMAHANPRYSQEVAKVRRKIFSDLATRSSGYISFDHLWTRMNDLWASILTDDFVFAFRNTLEVQAYLNFEKKCKKVIPHEINHSIHEWVAKQSYVLVKNCKNLKEIKEYKHKVHKNLEKRVEEMKSEMEALIKTIIQEDNFAEIIKQWESEFVKDMQYKIEREGQQALAEITENISNYEYQLLSGARFSQTSAELYETLSEIGSDSDTYLHRRQGTTIQGQIEEALTSGVGRSCSKFVTDELKSHSISNRFERPLYDMKRLTVLEEHISLNQRDPSETVKDICLRRAQQTLKQVLSRAQDYLSQLPKTSKFKLRYIDDLLSIASKFLDGTEIRIDQGVWFKFTKMYFAKVIVHMCRYVCPILYERQGAYDTEQRAQAEFCRKTSIKHLNNRKVQESEENSIIAILRDVLLPCLKEIIIKICPSKLKAKIKDLWKNKEDLSREILTYLAQQQNFNAYKEFLKGTLNYAIHWVQHVKIEAMDKKSSTGMSEIVTLAQDTLRVLIGNLKWRMKLLSDQFAGGEVLLSSWTEIFLNGIHDIHPNLRQTLHHTALEFNILERSSATEFKIANVTKFNQQFTKAILSIEDDLLPQLRNFSLTNVTWNLTATSQVVKEIWGGEEMCPFCDEPCRYSTVDHPVKHTCVCHRPRGIFGCIDSKSSELIVETCNEALMTDETFTYHIGSKVKKKKLKDYRKYYVDWAITPGYGENVSVYWRWFMTTFRKELSRCYRGSKPPAIPKEWNNISVAQAIESLKYQSYGYDDSCIYEDIGIPIEHEYLTFGSKS